MTFYVGTRGAAACSHRRRAERDRGAPGRAREQGRLYCRYCHGSVISSGDYCLEWYPWNSAAGTGLASSRKPYRARRSGATTGCPVYRGRRRQSGNSSVGVIRAVVVDAAARRHESVAHLVIRSICGHSVYNTGVVGCGCTTAHSRRSGCEILLRQSPYVAEVLPPVDFLLRR